MVGRHVGPLSGVLFDVVELGAAHQAPVPGDDGVGPLVRRLGVLAELEEMDAVFRQLGLSFQKERRQAGAVEGHVFRAFHIAKVDERGQDVHVQAHLVDICPAKQARLGPADKEGGAVAAVIVRGLLASQPGIVALGDELRGVERATARAPVVSHKDEDRVVFDSKLTQPFPQPAEVLVDVGDHPVEGGRGNVGVAQIGSLVLLIDKVGRMRGVG